MKLLTDCVGKGFTFNAIIFSVFFFKYKFYWLSKRAFTFNTFIFNHGKQLVTVNLQLENMVRFAKTFVHYRHKFNFVHLLRSP